MALVFLRTIEIVLSCILQSVSKPLLDSTGYHDRAGAISNPMIEFDLRHLGVSFAICLGGGIVK